MQEKFYEDWSHDQDVGLAAEPRGRRAQPEDRLEPDAHAAACRPRTSYVDLASKIAELMPGVGSDQQRGGWYDVVERVLQPGRTCHRFVWHDRKAWWQQEQGILAYLILHGVARRRRIPEHARESAAFYNAWFLDHDDGGVYFNVLANGMPYLLGNERFKGSHSMSGYHSIELCYLAAVYTNLLITKQPMDFYFKPQPGGFADNILRVAPDILPPGSIRIEQVWIDGEAVHRLRRRGPDGQDPAGRDCAEDQGADHPEQLNHLGGTETTSTVLRGKHLWRFQPLLLMGPPSSVSMSPLMRPHGERVFCVADTETTHSSEVAATRSVALRSSRRARERRSDGPEVGLGGTDGAGPGRERDHVGTRSLAAMFRAGPRLGPRPLRALPVVITGLAAQCLGRCRSRGPGARDLGLRAREAAPRTAGRVARSRHRGPRGSGR